MMYRELGPLRKEVAQYRQELGLLTIEESERDKIHAIRVESELKHEWRYRIYLPEGKQYRLRAAQGTLPAPVGFSTKKKYLTQVSRNSSGSSRSWEAGEFLLAFRVYSSEKVDSEDVWTFETRRVGEGSKGSTSMTIDWMKDERLWGSSSSMVSNQQKSYDPDKPLELLEVRRGVLTETAGGGYSVTSQQGEAEGFKLWIEPQ